MDGYLSMPLAWTYSQAALDPELRSINECNFALPFDIVPNAYSFWPDQYSQQYSQNTVCALNQTEHIISPPNPYSLYKPTSYTPSHKDSCPNLMIDWTTHNFTLAGCSADAVVPRPISNISTAQPINPTTTTQSTYEASPSPSSQRASSDHDLTSSCDHSPSSDHIDSTSPRNHNTSPRTGRKSDPPAVRTCNDHCCNGRVFSSRSNLLRHQRERTRDARLLACPLCGATFYRLGTRDHHIRSARCQRLWHRHQRYRSLGYYVAIS